MTSEERAVYYSDAELAEQNTPEYMTNNKPNPGSRLAFNMGCTCAVSDNHYGKGFPMGEVIGHTNDGIPIRRNVFWISEDCRLHGGIPVLDEVEERINQT